MKCLAQTGSSTLAVTVRFAATMRMQAVCGPADTATANQSPATATHTSCGGKVDSLPAYGMTCMQKWPASLSKLFATVMTMHREGRDKGLLMVVKHHRVDTMCHCSCMTDQQCGCQHCKHLISSDVDMSCRLSKHQHH